MIPAQATGPSSRGRAIGINDSFAGGISVVMALVTGPLIECSRTICSVTESGDGPVYPKFLP